MTAIDTRPDGATAAATAAAPSTPAKGEVLVQVDHLTKKFGKFTAVNDITFQVNRREIFGFLGPNGAGKSTTIKMICTLMSLTDGHITVAGHDVSTDSDAVRSAIGIVFQDNSLDSGLTAKENLDFHCIMYHIPAAERESRIKDVLALMDLTDFQDRMVKTYSGGMRRRLEIARGLLHRPELLILDEPTVGLDPQTRNYIWQYVRELRDKHDTTVFMTTHYMDEAENCDRIAVIDKGQIIALDTPEGLKRLIGQDQIELTVADPVRTQEAIQKAFNLQAKVEGKTLHLEVARSEEFVPRLLTELTHENLTVQTLEVHRPSLEDVFIRLTGHVIREEEGEKDQLRLTARERGRLQS